MNPSVIALSSRIGAGKSTIARALAERLGWPRVSFGDYVREVARNQGMEESRTVLQEVGESLVKEDAAGFTRAVLSRVNFKSGAVVDGVRHMEILHALEGLAAPLAVYLIYVDTAETTRIQRLTERGMAADEIKVADSHSTEVQVRGVLRENAALQTCGGGNTSEAVDAIVGWLNSQQQR
jgi:dephospho-CoA kinase